jgi:hypothetical protein
MIERFRRVGRLLSPRQTALFSLVIVSMAAAVVPVIPAERAGASTGAPLVSVASSPGGGAWAATSDGAVTAIGGAPLFGSLSGDRLAAPVVAIASTPDGKGYWMATADGGLFAFGDAHSFGSLTGLHLAAPVVGLAPTADGGGYWFASADGGVFAFGDAPFLGSLGGIHLAAPVVAISRTPDGRGYWLAGSDGGVFTFGDAPFAGSLAATPLANPIIGIMANPRGQGYWLVASDGSLSGLGGAPALPSSSGTDSSPVVAASVVHTGLGAWIASADGRVNAVGSVPGTSTSPPTTSPPTTVPGGPTPPLAGGPSRLVFDDEFNGPLNTSVWETCWWYTAPSATGCSHDNNELEWYLRSDPHTANGQLVLTANQQTVTGTDPSGAATTYNYTSGEIDTHGAFSFQYGYVEWKAQIPAGQGLWPALWMLPEDGASPPEIDALEVLGNDPTTAYFTNHSPDGTQCAPQASFTNLSAAPHVYGVDWQPNSVTWYVDGTQVAQCTTADGAISTTPMYLIMNLAVGGSWPGPPNATTPFPAQMTIDWVHVWQ